MPRVKRGMMTRKRHNRILKDASGYWGGRHRLFKTANEAVRKAMDDSFNGRKQKKRDFRALWIARINAGCRQHGISYSQFIHGLMVANIDINRKVLSEIAIRDAADFASLVEKARLALA